MRARALSAALALSALAASAAPAFGAAAEFKVATDRTVDASSLESIVRDVVRLSGAKTDDEKAIAIYDYLHATIFHFAYPVEKAPQTVGPLKVLDVYGWGLCGGQHTVLKALFETAGWPVRYRGWPGHTTIEVQYGGTWHYFDVFLKCYFWTKDKKTIAGQDDISADPSIVLDGVKDGRVPPTSYLCCGDDAPGIVQGCKASKPYPVSKHEDGWASVTGRDPAGYRPLPTLPSGAALRLEWKAEPNGSVVPGKNVHTCGTKDFRNDKVLGPVLEHYGVRTWANGRLAYGPDFARAADVADIELSGAKVAGGKLAGPGAAVFKLPLPYPWASATVSAVFEGGDGKLSVSTDGGKTWQPVEPGDISPVVRQKYDVQVKAEFAGSLAKFGLDALVEHNRGALPHLLPGKNVVTASLGKDALPKDCVVTVTYAYQEATTPASRNQYNGSGVSYGETKTVSRDLAASPTTFTIDVGGNTPPKMLWLERSVKGK